MGSPGLSPGSAWPGTTTLLGGVWPKPGACAGTERKISPGRGSGWRGSPGLTDAGSGAIGAAGEGGAGVRRCSGLSGAAGMAGACTLGRSTRVTGGGSMSTSAGRSGAAPSAGGGAGDPGKSVPGDGATAGAGGVGGAGGASATLAVSTGSSTAARISFSSSWRNIETFASADLVLIGGGSTGPAPALRRVDSCSASAPPSGGVIGDEARRNGGGRGGAIGRSFPVLGSGGGSVGTDFRVSVFDKGC